jgi:hypothetical protein
MGIPQADTHHHSPERPWLVAHTASCYTPEEAAGIAAGMFVALEKRIWCPAAA